MGKLVKKNMVRQKGYLEIIFVGNSMFRVLLFWIKIIQVWGIKSGMVEGEAPATAKGWLCCGA